VFLSFSCVRRDRLSRVSTIFTFCNFLHRMVKIFRTLYQTSQ
jgi:hypothetical protein